MFGQGSGEYSRTDQIDLTPLLRVHYSLSKLRPIFWLVYQEYCQALA
jgi:hypothetical protein